MMEMWEFGKWVTEFGWVVEMKRSNGDFVDDVAEHQEDQVMGSSCGFVRLRFESVKMGRVES